MWIKNEEELFKIEPIPVSFVLNNKYTIIPHMIRSSVKENRVFITIVLSMTNDEHLCIDRTVGLI